MVLVALGAALCYASQVAAGWLVWRSLCPTAGSRALVWAAALLVGPAAVVVQMLLYHACGVPFRVPWLVLPWALWLAATWRRAARRGPAARAPSAAARPAPLAAAAIAVLTVAVAAAACALPIHEGDEVNNFAVFARVFGSLGSLAPQRLAALCEPGHVEYPHLVALNQAWLFALDGASAPWTARGFEVLGALAFFLACAGVCGTGGVRTAAVLLAAATPAVLQFAVGFADVRLLATFVLLGHEAGQVWRGADARAPLRYALLLGTAALTKNEGLAVAAAGTLVLALATLRHRTFARGLAALAIAGALLALWPLVRGTLGMTLPYVDRALGLPFEILRAQTPRVLAEWGRLMFPLDAPGLGRWGLLFWIAVPSALLLARRDRAVRWLLLAWAAHLALYTYVIGVARPGDLEALFGTAAPRLLLHTIAWPVLVLARAVSGNRADDRPLSTTLTPHRAAHS